VDDSAGRCIAAIGALAGVTVLLIAANAYVFFLELTNGEQFVYGTR